MEGKHNRNRNSWLGVRAKGNHPVMRVGDDGVADLGGSGLGCNIEIRRKHTSSSSISGNVLHDLGKCCSVVLGHRRRPGLWLPVVHGVAVLIPDLADEVWFHDNTLIGDSCSNEGILQGSGTDVLLTNGRVGLRRSVVGELGLCWERGRGNTWQVEWRLLVVAKGLGFSRQIMGTKIQAHVGKSGVARRRKHDGQGASTATKAKVVELLRRLRNRQRGRVGVVLVDERWIEFVCSC